jgi:hypothetical protein
VFASAGKTDPPSLFVLSQTSTGTVLTYIIGAAPAAFDGNGTSGTRLIYSAGFEALATRRDTPGNAGEDVGESDGQHIAVQPPFLAASIQGLSP